MPFWRVLKKELKKFYWKCYFCPFRYTVHIHEKRTKLLQFDERKILEEYSTCMPKVIGEYLTVTQVSNVSKQKRNSRWGRGGLGAICLLASRKLLDIGCAHASSFQRVCSWFKNYERFH